MSISQLIMQSTDQLFNQSISQILHILLKNREKILFPLNNKYFVLVPAENSADVSNFTAQLIVKGKIDNMYEYICIFLLLFMIYKIDIK